MCAPEQLRLPARHVTHANALWHVLPAQHRRGSSDSLGSEIEERCVDSGELDQVVGKAEALFRPTCSAQVPSQKGVRSRLVQFEAQHLVHLPGGISDLLGGASAVGHEGQPRRQLLVLGRAAAVQARGRQGAGHAGELQLAALHLAHREVGVDMAEGSEEHVLGVRGAVEGHGRVHSGVHLGDPVEEDGAHLAVDRGALCGAEGHTRPLQLQEDLALGRRQDGLLALVADRVAPEVEFLQHDVGLQGRGQRPRAGVADAVVAQGEAPEGGARRAEDGGQSLCAGVADAVAAEAELAEAGVLGRGDGQGEGTGADVAEVESAELLVKAERWRQPPLQASGRSADPAEAGARRERRQKIHDALKELHGQLHDAQPSQRCVDRVDLDEHELDRRANAGRPEPASGRRGRRGAAEHGLLRRERQRQVEDGNAHAARPRLHSL
mmetsp:Transcript_47963/g.137768  ORF Transcript_47963/g.137768 Transcript_47963/m.137768 type:complete len:438 (+) Transcript_47963:391-1704(+)